MLQKYNYLLNCKTPNSNLHSERFAGKKIALQTPHYTLFIKITALINYLILKFFAFYFFSFTPVSVNFKNRIQRTKIN